MREEAYEKEVWEASEEPEQERNTIGLKNNNARLAGEPVITHIDGVAIEKISRPAPPVTEYLAKRIRWFCSRCQSMQDCLEIDEPSQILKLKCGHSRNAVIKTVNV